jgi:DNA-binding CsgD family transcriptional regulator
MASVTSGEVSPSILGVTYCSVIDACHEVFDLRRAQEWTAALSQWCARQPDMTPYRGECLVRRAEIMQLHGAWPDALEEAERAQEWFARPPGHRSVGAAWYQVGEMHRLRGAFAEAEAAYRRASQAGRDPQPGQALMRLAQGQTEVARTSILRAMQEARARRARARMLPALVEIALASGDVAGARGGADELAGIAEDLDAPFLRATSAHALGAVLLAEQDARGALNSLRSAVATWRDLEAPYDDARARVLIGLACRALGDSDSAALELDAARQIFHRLGAATDEARVAALVSGPPRAPSGGLTAREVEVLGLVATGATNRAIAAQLGLSEKTVARHLSNIFTKLGLTSRAAATAFAYQHGLVKLGT